MFKVNINELSQFIIGACVIFVVFVMYMLASKTWEQADVITRLEKENTELYTFIATESLVGDENVKLQNLKEHLIKKYRKEDFKTGE